MVRKNTWTEEGIPTLIGYPTEIVYSVQVWCPYCMKWHTHGAKNGHRVAHCTINTPFSGTGYYIKMLPRAGLKRLLRDVKRTLNVWAYVHEKDMVE